MARSVRRFKEVLEFRSLPFNQIKSHRYFPAIILAVVVLTAACIHIWQRVVVISLVKEVSTLRKENFDLVDAGHKMQTDIAALSMATRIEHYAIDTLGLQRISLDHLYTMIRISENDRTTDEWGTMISSIRRVAEYLPVVSNAQAAAQELEPIKFDQAGDGGSGR